jgi:hypothetical protein
MPCGVKHTAPAGFVLVGFLWLLFMSARVRRGLWGTDTGAMVAGVVLLLKDRGQTEQQEKPGN